MDSLHGSKITRWYDIAAVGSCVTILILALVLGHFHRIGTFGVETDFYGAYVIHTEEIMSGKPYTYQYQPPGYCLLLAAVSSITDDIFTAAKIISAFATAILGLVTYLLFKALFSPRIALVSTILLLIALIPVSFLAATDVVGAAAVMLPLWIFLRKPVPTINACFLSGILAGFAYLIRANAIFVSVGIGLSLLFINLRQEKPRGVFMKFGLFIFGVLLITSPWFIYNWRINGSPFANTSYLQIAAHFYHPTGSQLGTAMGQMAQEFDSLSEVVLHDPLGFLQKYLKGVLYSNAVQLATQALPFPAYFFAVGGLLLLFWDLSRRRLIFLMVCFLGYLLLGLVGFIFRYYFFLFPLIFLLVVYFLFHKYIATVLSYIPFFRNAVSWLVVMIIVVLLGVGSYVGTKLTFALEPRYLFEIADFLKKRSSPDDTIIVRKPHLAYLAGLKSAFPLAGTAGEYQVKMEEIGARYIAYSNFEAFLWPGLKSLSDPSAVPDSFNLIYSHEPTNTLIYEIDK